MTNSFEEIDQTKIEIDQLTTQRNQIDEAIRSKRAHVQTLIDAETEKVSHIKVGQEVETSYGWGKETRRYRITSIQGYMYILKDGSREFTPIFNGVSIRKDGTEGAHKSRLSGFKVVYPLNGGEPVRGNGLEGVRQYNMAVAAAQTGERVSEAVSEAESGSEGQETAKNG